jgi:DNA polymerase
VTAAEYLPQRLTLESLREAAKLCHGCDLWRNATQTVFGEGPADARLMFVGEQPGDQEDKVGQPFVGPAGRIFDQALDEVGIDRSRVYVTNTVKHFKWQPRGKRRIHQKPSAAELAACRTLVDSTLAEVVIATIHPSAILRAQDRDAEYAGFVDDLERVVALL